VALSLKAVLSISRISNAVFLSRIRYSEEVYKLYREPCLSHVVKLKRLQWARHIRHMDIGCIQRKVLHDTIGGKRPVGKPKRRGIEAIEENSRKILSIGNWKREQMDRQVWRSYLQEAKARCWAVVP
jgi:hypothetical protein